MKNNKKIQINNDMAIEFSNLVHADDDGYISLGVQPAGQKMKPKHVKGAKEFAEELMRCYATKSNVYMTPNSCYIPERISHNIRRLNSIYVDIDCHDDTQINDTNSAAAEGIDDLIYSLYFDLINTKKIPEPNIINSTGRGIHLYWLIEPENKYKVLQHNAISRAICNKISDYLEYKKSKYNVDHAISQDIVRYMRIPGTINQKTNTMCVSSIRHTKRYTLSELQEQYKFIKNVDKQDKPYSEKSRNKTLYLGTKQVEIRGKIIELDPNPPKAKQLYIKRMKDLTTLSQLRLSAPMERQCRKRMTFLYRHFALCAGYSCKEAWEMTVKFNNGFHTPLKTKILARLSKSAEAAYLRETYYYYKSSTIIKMLGISRNEIKSMTTLVDDDTRILLKNEHRRQSYGLRDENGLTIKQQQMLKSRIIIAKCVEDGLTQDEIARKTGFSLSKVKRLRSELKAGRGHLKASNNTAEVSIKVLFERNFNQKYFKLMKSSKVRPSYITFLWSNNVPSLLEQLSISLDEYYIGYGANTS